MKIGIMGAGRIAGIMAETLQADPQMCCAIASRSLEKAQEFADRWGFKKAYGSYEEMVCDPEIDLVYIATPHSCHCENAKLALNHGKHVLCEKAFAGNAAEAEEMIALAREKGLFITEAMWTRYMPLSKKIKEMLDNGVIGTPHMLSATIGYPMWFKPKIQETERCGGALLDITVYSINFARMFFGGDYVKSSSLAYVAPTGTDFQGTVSLLYGDGRMANLQGTAWCANDLQGVISGEEGYIIVDNVNNPSEAKVFNKDHILVETVVAEGKRTGYEYEIYECRDAIKKGLLESPCMPHAETIAIMKQMDALRAEWGVKYPNDR